MTPERAMEIIAGGESLDVEFKAEPVRPLSDDDLIDAVVCLANRPGDATGYLLIGVEDSGAVSGARPRQDDGATPPSRMQALIAARTSPSLSVRVEVVQLEVPVVVIQVPPVFAPVGTTRGKYLRRALGGDGRPACLPLSFHEMQSMQSSRGQLDYSTLGVAGAQWEDLDPLEFDRLRRAIRESRGQGDAALLQLSNLELAKALGAVDANHEVRAIRVLGLLLFGTEEALQKHLPAHEIAFQALRGTDVETNDFFRWPLLRVMEEIESRFRARNKEQELQFGLLRVAVPDYAPAAFREALANACIHRDYTRLGAIHIQWHDNYIEISNPGGFPNGVRLDNLLVTPPRPRNPRLADAMKRTGIVERTGRGIDKIFEEQLRNGRPAPSYARSNEANVSVTLPGGDANLEFARLVAEETQAGRELRLDELLLLNLTFTERQTTVKRAAEVVQKTEPEARAMLQRLVETGLLESRGSLKSRVYHLSADVYRRLGELAAYVRQRGLSRQRHEQMVLEYARAHGRVTRREAAELCRITSLQARHLLQKMTDKEILSPIGQGRNRYYVNQSKVLG